MIYEKNLKKLVKLVTTTFTVDMYNACTTSPYKGLYHGYRDAIFSHLVNAPGVSCQGRIQDFLKGGPGLTGLLRNLQSQGRSHTPPR